MIYNSPTKLKDIIIISDNNYFSLGASLLLKKFNVMKLSPAHVLKDNYVDRTALYLLFINNRESHKEVCKKFQGSYCNMVFFLPVDTNIEKENNFHPCFWSAKITQRCLSKRVFKILNKYPPPLFHTLSSSRKSELVKISLGVGFYMEKLLVTKLHSKSIHRYSRKITSLVGFSNVNIHNIFLSEYIAAGHVATCNNHIEPLGTVRVYKGSINF
jgi:hypothetical protein